jgi:hypothetical protein
MGSSSLSMALTISQQAQTKRETPNITIRSTIEAIYPLIVSECTAALDVLAQGLQSNRLCLDQASDPKLKASARLKILQSTKTHPRHFYDTQMDLLHDIEYTFRVESGEFFESMGDEREEEPRQQQQNQTIPIPDLPSGEHVHYQRVGVEQDEASQNKQEAQGPPRPPQQSHLARNFRSDLQFLMWKTNQLRDSSDRLGIQIQATSDPITPPSRPTNPSARLLQNRLDQIAFATNPLLALMFMTTLYGMNLGIFVDGGLVSLKKYLISALVFAAGVFAATFFFEPAARWIADAVGVKGHVSIVRVERERVILEKEKDIV